MELKCYFFSGYIPYLFITSEKRQKRKIRQCTNDTTIYLCHTPIACNAKILLTVIYFILSLSVKQKSYLSRRYCCCIHTSYRKSDQDYIHPLRWSSNAIFSVDIYRTYLSQVKKRQNEKQDSVPMILQFTYGEKRQTDKDSVLQFTIYHR